MEKIDQIAQQKESLAVADAESMTKSVTSKMYYIWQELNSI